MNSIPVIGWLIDLVAKVSLAVPFWIFWTWWDVGEKFFYWLPEVYTNIGFWECVRVFICLGVLISFSPFRVSSSSTSEARK